ncbi:hypothetical protein F3Y22_tig00112517pilonHSYRG00091 [Hibiscus syriacus]|uniref:Uncharacterized protein n=1 Tax=Hibiscus syriacus TaxID=106335 RepID=A0A6A2WXG3_HIBSY|nr:hypothetical protein F3Y22_tig00112517pilonHSYRG00091 [Hibiscus syriacus]
MATLAYGGAAIGLINNPCSSQKLIKLPSPSPFLGKKFRIKLSSKPNLSIPRTTGVLSLKAELIDAVRELFVGVGVGLPCTVRSAVTLFTEALCLSPTG